MENHSDYNESLPGKDENAGHKPDTHVAENLNQVLKEDWEQTKADLPGLKGKDTGQSITDTIRGEVHDE